MSKEKKKGGFGKFLFGASIGAALGLIFAPKKGSETRHDIKVKFDELIGQLKEVDPSEVKELITNKIDEIKTELESLNKEKVLKIAREKSQDIKEKAEDLLKIAQEKGNVALQKVAKEAKAKAIEVTKNILAALEKDK